MALAGANAEQSPHQQQNQIDRNQNVDSAGGLSDGLDELQGFSTVDGGGHQHNDDGLHQNLNGGGDGDGGGSLDVNLDPNLEGIPDIPPAPMGMDD